MRLSERCWINRERAHQCDQMARLFFNFGPFTSGIIRPMAHKICRSRSIKFRIVIQPSKIAQDFTKVAKFCQILSHCWVTFRDHTPPEQYTVRKLTQFFYIILVQTVTLHSSFQIWSKGLVNPRRWFAVINPLGFEECLECGKSKTVLSFTLSSALKNTL